MKKHIIFPIIITFFAWNFLAYADTDVAGEEAHGKPLEVVLQEIRISQGITENERIDPDKVSDEKLEELGDAVMSVMHPDPKEHEWMDNMMGGEGSSTLSAMHKIMGYNYLMGSFGGMMGPGMMGRGMMGRGMMGPGMMGQGMMGQGTTGTWSFLGMIFWIVLIVGIILLIVWLVTRMPGVSKREESALEILKKRYAKGEITKQEFEKMKKDLE